LECKKKGSFEKGVRGVKKNMGHRKNIGVNKDDSNEHTTLVNGGKRQRATELRVKDVCKERGPCNGVSKRGQGWGGGGGGAKLRRRGEKI